MARNQSKPIHQLAIAPFERMFPDEDAVCAYRVGRRGPEGVRCPRCDAEVKRPVSTTPWHWPCRECAPETTYRFSHIAGTIFENTNKPPRPGSGRSGSRCGLSPAPANHGCMRKDSWFAGSRQPIHHARWNAKPDRPVLIRFRNSRCSARCFCYPTLSQEMSGWLS